VLQHGQSEYVRQFRMDISNDLTSLTGRVLKSVTLKYNTASKQPEAVRHFLTPFGDAMTL